MQQVMIFFIFIFVNGQIMFKIAKEKRIGLRSHPSKPNNLKLVWFDSVFSMDFVKTKLNQTCYCKQDVDNDVTLTKSSFVSDSKLVNNQFYVELVLHLIILNAHLGVIWLLMGRITSSVIFHIIITLSDSISRHFSIKSLKII